MLANLLNIVSKMSFANWNLRNTWIIAKQKRATRLTLIIRLTIAAPQCLIAFFERAERLAKQDARVRIVWAKRVYGRMCRAAHWEPQTMYCGAALRGARGETSSLPFLCRRFFSQTEKKCRNAGSVKSLIIVGREGSKPIINKSKLLYRLPSIADSREGCPYERSVKQAFSKILCRSRGIGASSRRTLQNTRQ